MIAEMVEIRKLGDLCEVITKGTTPTSIGHAFQDEGINFVKIESLTENGGFIESKFAHISEEGNEALKRSQLQENDILFSIAGALGRTAIVTADILPANTNQALAIIRLKEDIGLNHAYLIRYLISAVITEEIEKLKGGVAQQNLSLGQLKAIEIPIPPLPEQERIVAKLDTAFAAIDTAKANVERNLNNAKELFQSKLNEVFSQKGDGWVEVTLDKVCSITSKLVDPRETEHENLLHVGGGNIVSMSGELVELKTAKEEGLVSGKFLFDETMVLYNKIRPYLVKVTRPDFVGLCSADMYPLKPFDDKLDRDYLYYLLISKPFTDYAIIGSARAGMPKVNRPHLFAFSFWLPPLEWQPKAVAALNMLIERTQILETHYTRKLTELETLKKSLLERAFRGEL